MVLVRKMMPRMEITFCLEPLITVKKNKAIELRTESTRCVFPPSTTLKAKAREETLENTSPVIYLFRPMLTLLKLFLIRYKLLRPATPMVRTKYTKVATSIIVLMIIREPKKLLIHFKSISLNKIIVVITTYKSKHSSTNFPTLAW
jgi:hypothetical protein